MMAFNYCSTHYFSLEEPWHILGDASGTDLPVELHACVSVRVWQTVIEVLYLSSKSLNTKRHCSFWITRTCGFASVDAVLQSALDHKFMLLLEAIIFFWCYANSRHPSAHKQADEFLTNQIQASGWTVLAFRQPPSNQFNSRHCPHPKCEQEIFFLRSEKCNIRLKSQSFGSIFVFLDCYRFLNSYYGKKNQVSKEKLKAIITLRNKGYSVWKAH